MEKDFSTFDAEVQQRKEQMLQCIEAIDIDKLKVEGVKLSFGGKTFRFTDLEIVNEIDAETKVRREFKDKLNIQQQKIREKVNSKINELLMLHQNKLRECERKEKQIKAKYEKTALMPDIQLRHINKGLSVVMGNNNGELMWCYRAVYHPRFILVCESNSSNKVRKEIPKKLLKRMTKDILIVIRTKNENVLGVVTKIDEDGEIKVFSHYHQQSGDDCWGSWKHPRKWNTPDDIITIAKEAEAILEVINHGSIAKRNPTKMPRLDMILEAVKDLKPFQEKKKITKSKSKDDEDVWNTL